jgi:hypothetical protein
MYRKWRAKDENSPRTGDFPTRPSDRARRNEADGAVCAKATNIVVELTMADVEKLSKTTQGTQFMRRENATNGTSRSVP